MDARRFRQLAEVFGRAVEVPDDAGREARVRWLCGEDSRLADLVLELLSIHDATAADALVRAVREALQRLEEDPP